MYVLKIDSWAIENSALYFLIDGGYNCPMPNLATHPDDFSNVTLQDIVPESELSQHARALIAYAGRRNAPLPKAMTKANIVQQFQQTFELVGGIPRLALWADENPGAFFAMYSKLLPAQAKIELNVLTPDEESIKQMSTDDLKLLVLSYIPDPTSEQSDPISND